MKKTLFIILILFTVFNLKAEEKDSIKKVVLDYAESYYTGEFEKTANSIHPDLKKASAEISEISGNLYLMNSSYSQLIENVRSKTPVEKSKIPEIKIEILKMDENFANVRVKSPDFFDYLLLVKIETNWKILNIASANKVNSDKYDQDKLTAAVELYKTGILGGDAKRLELSILPGFSRGQRATDNSTGKSRIIRTGFERMIELSLNKTGALEEVASYYKIRILDANEKLATVELEIPFNLEYLQLCKGTNGWKVFNSFRRGNPNYSFINNSPVYLEEKMPDFTLPIYNGDKFTVSQNKGKKTMLIFLRGWIGQIWCPLCQYQYLELAELEKINKWRDKYNLDIYFVLPYSKERIDNWFTSFKRSTDIINGWRNLTAAPLFSDFVNKYYPIKFELKENQEIPVTFPILIDEDKTVSKRFKLFTTFWDGVTADQNVSSIFVLDEEGVVQFKYVSQQTQDRPTYNYLMKFIKNMN